jgi:hypothetical protein
VNHVSAACRWNVNVSMYRNHKTVSGFHTALLQFNLRNMAVCQPTVLFDLASGITSR